MSKMFGYKLINLMCHSLGELPTIVIDVRSVRGTEIGYSIYFMGDGTNRYRVHSWVAEVRNEQ